MSGRVVVFLDLFSELIQSASAKFNSLSASQQEELALYIIPEVSYPPPSPSPVLCNPFLTKSIFSVFGQKPWTIVQGGLIFASPKKVLR